MYLFNELSYFDAFTTNSLVIYFVFIGEKCKYHFSGNIYHLDELMIYFIFNQQFSKGKILNNLIENHFKSFRLFPFEAFFITLLHSQLCTLFILEPHIHKQLHILVY